MATADTVELGPPHEPMEESIKTFDAIETDLKKTLQHLRHDMNKHEPAYFAAVDSLTDQQLTDFSSEDLVLVRVAKSAYGLHLLGKVVLPDSEGHTFPQQGGSYIHFRAFVGGDTVKLHCIHTEEIEQADGTKTFKAIFTKDDPLEWFDT